MEDLVQLENNMADYLKYAEFIGIPKEKREIWVEGYTKGRKEGEQNAKFDASNAFHKEMLSQYNCGKETATKETVDEFFNILDDFFAKHPAGMSFNKWISTGKNSVKNLVNTRIFKYLVD